MKVRIRTQGKYITTLDNVVFPYKNKLHSIQSGFVCDGATIPRPLRWICHPLDGRVIKAAIVHDALYSNLYDIVPTRKEADTIFYKMLEIPRRKAYLFYLGVRIFGGIRYGHKPKHPPEW